MGAPMYAVPRENLKPSLEKRALKIFYRILSMGFFNAAQMATARTVLGSI